MEKVWATLTIPLLSRLRGRPKPDNRSAMDDPTLVFIHIMKTGGTSFRQWLVDYFAGEVFIHKSRDLRPFKSEGDVVRDRGIDAAFAPTSADIRDYYDRFGAAGLQRHRAIAGHFTFDYPFVAALAREVVFCAIVRDPVARVVSRYNWIRLNRHNAQYSCVDGNTLFQSLERGGPFLRTCINQQVNFIFGSRRNNHRWTIVCNYRRLDLLADKIAGIYGRPSIPLPHRNHVDPSYRIEVESQPDFPDAVNLIRSLNADEIDFVNSVGDLSEFNRPESANAGQG